MMMMMMIEHHFYGFSSFFYNLFTYVVCYIQGIFNQNPKLKQ